ncbi:uncharacterized protein LOC124937714 isoform X2 [Impatiens glandulifera]|uniref:uncharacterized protein LOC124937714 isoform X2 n=1 Tax=Impatiens glandulifera TaxID=253017 RepID=UPI001FB13DB6|nr:uncharacterized protein LOC124937714 isoform X2 [Impatiens glandulifera]
MSKKKPVGGSTTMTLKDFHGGSIPSDLPLPSAPGVMVRPSDRSGFERQSAWGNPMGRSDQRLRPGSAGAVRNFDDKTPFLAHSVIIGRNFDEDERKPLDGVSAPRRTVFDDTIIAVPVATELKPDYSSNGRLPNRQVASSVSCLGGSSATSHAGNTKEAGYAGLNNQNCGSNSYSGGFSDSVHAGGNYSGSGNSNVNVWAMRKEVVNCIETMSPKSSAPNTALKLAHASAVEKVSSGRWQSKLAANHPTEVEIIRHGETESELHSKDEVIYNSNKSYLAMDAPSMMEYSDGGLARLADRGLSLDDGIHSGEREFPAHDFSRFPKTFPVTSETNTSTYAEGLQHSHKYELQPPVPSELSDRPKLKLLPRSKPLHSLDLPVEHKQQMHDSGHQVSVTGVRGNLNTNKAEPGGFYSGNQAPERPKLNLKPRSQPIEKIEANAERERNSVFGGARPRELVLKDHGLEDLTHNNQDPGAYNNNRLKQDIQTGPTHVSPSLYNDNASIENNRMKINNDRRDSRGVDPERTADAQKRSWQKDNWRIRREIEKQPQQQEEERPPSPETWRRKPAEPRVKTTISAEVVPGGVHYGGKAASAVELAQAFSKSVSDSKTDQFSGQRGGVLTQGKIPFSRLTTSSPSPRPQINGY